MNRHDSIENLIKILNGNMQNDGILAIAIFDRDGNPVAYAAQDHIKGDEISATGGGLLSMSIKVMESMNMAPMERVILETDKGTILLEHLQNGLGIILVTSPGISVGRARLIMLNLTRRIRKAVPL